MIDPKPVDEQNWRVGDACEQVDWLIDCETGRRIPPGSRGIVLDVAMGVTTRGRELLSLRVTSCEDWSEAASFRKIVPTMEEPKRAEDVPFDHSLDAHVYWTQGQPLPA